MFNLLSRQAAFYFAFVFSLNIAVNTYMKFAFEDGRPFMFTSRVFPFVCELEFGNPCDEVMNFVTMVTAFGLYYYEQLKVQDDEFSSCQKFGIGISALFSLLGLILFSLQGVYNGANSIDSVLFGLELGIFVAWLSHYFFRKKLDTHVTNLMEGMYLNRYRQVTFGALVIFLVFFVIETISYVSVLGDFSPPSKWLLQISVKCPIDSTQNILIFHDAVYAEYGMTFFVLGCYLGLIVDAKYQKGTVRSVNNTTLMQTLKRVLLSSIPTLLMYAVPVFFIPQKWFTIYVLITKYGISSFVIGYLMFGYSKVIYSKFDLVNLEDTSLERESVMNLGKFEEEEDRREMSGKSNSKLFAEGIQVQNTF
jgi:hypothetical protein